MINQPILAGPSWSFLGNPIAQRSREPFAFPASTLILWIVVHHHVATHFTYEPLAFWLWLHRSKIVILNAVGTSDGII